MPKATVNKAQFNAQELTTLVSRWASSTAGTQALIDTHSRIKVVSEALDKISYIEPELLRKPVTV